MQATSIFQLNIKNHSKLRVLKCYLSEITRLPFSDSREMAQAMEETVYQINLQQLVEKYIWSKYKSDVGFPKKYFLRKDRYYCDIRWGYVDFVHETTSSIRPNTPGVGQKDVQLYFSEYENNTGHDQTYTFHTSRETTASTKVELQENYTVGAETNLEISLGEVVKFGGGVSGSMSITDTKGQEFSRTMSWDIDTEIKVPKWNKAKASLYVYEEPSIVDFTVKTTVALAAPSRRLPVTIRKRDDDEEVKTYWITNIECLFDSKLTGGDTPKVKLETRLIEGTENMGEVIAILTTRGVCRNISWQNQHVKVECERIEGAPPATTPEGGSSTGDQDGE